MTFTSAFSQTPVLIKDINNKEDAVFNVSVPPATISSVPLGGDIIVGQGNITEIGRELVVFSVSSNTYEYIDIYSGSLSSDPSNFVVLGGEVYFSAEHPDYGRELWKTDGTAIGTVLVHDIEPGTTSSSPNNINVLGSKLFFRASTSVNGSEPVESNGSTFTIFDLNVGASGSGGTSSVLGPDNSLYFAATTASEGNELRKYNGTTITLVNDIVSGTGSSFPGNLYYDSISNKLYFQAISTGNGNEPWISDGTTVGTTMLRNLNTGNSSSTPSRFFSALNKVFFMANSGSGFEPHVTDGTSGGTTQLLDIFGGSGSSNPEFFAEVNGSVLFKARTSSEGFELWKTDGTAINTQILNDFVVGFESSNPSFIGQVSSSQALFSIDSTTVGQELYTTDGTSLGTVVLSDIYSGAEASSPQKLIKIGTDHYFTATKNISNIAKTVLLKTDGTPGGTVTVNNQTISGNSGIVNLAGNFVPKINDKLYYIFNNEVNGYEFWRTDGTTLQTSIPVETLSGARSLLPSSLLIHGTDIYFVGTDSYTNLYKFNTESATVSKLTNFTSFSSFSSKLELLNNKVIFTFDDPVSGRELWSSDGTELGTTMIKDIVSGTSSGVIDFNNSKVVGNKLFFYGTDNDVTFGSELWVTDGTEIGTVMVKDINPGTSASNIGSIQKLDGNRVVFSADDGVNGVELWISDGTTVGTNMIKEFEAGATGGDPNQMIYVNDGFVILIAYTNDAGYELWKTDGTTSGTIFIKDIVSGAGNPTFYDQFVFGNKVVLNLDDGVNGAEPWITDGTSAGTFLLQDINPGAFSSTPRNFVLAGMPQKVYFAVNDSLEGSELWGTDGTVLGTALVGDFNPGSTSTDPQSFGYLDTTGELLFVGLIDSNIGSELYKITVDSCPSDNEKLSAGVCGCGNSDADNNLNGQVDCIEPTPTPTSTPTPTETATATPTPVVTVLPPDECLEDNDKTLAGVCGCGVSDADLNQNGQSDCLDPSSSFIPLTPKVKVLKKGTFILTASSVSGATQYEFVVSYKVGNKRKNKTYRSSNLSIKKKIKDLRVGTKVSYKLRLVVGNTTTAYSKAKSFKSK